MDKNILEHLPKAVRIKEEIKDKLRNGAFGSPGSDFVSVRKLAEHAEVSLVTAQRIMTMLKEDGVILLENGRHVISKALKKEGPASPENQRKNLIGMVVTNIENPFFAALSREMEQAAKERSYQLMIASSNYDVERERKAIEMFRESGACGIISCPSPDSNAGKIYSDLNDLPYVFLARKPLGLKADSVLVENFNAAKLISKHLVAEGYENFGYLGIKMLSNDQRLSGYKYGLEELGCALPEKNIFKTDEMTYTDICPEMLDFLKNAPKPFAVFCFHDLLALLLIKACNKLGLEIPCDVAAAGFDNLPFASKVTPSLTTIGYPLKSMARLAFNRLIEKSSGGNVSGDPVSLQVEPKLYVRESSSARALTIEHNIVSEDLIYQAS